MKRFSRPGALALCAGSLVLAGLVTAGAAGAASGGHTARLSLPSAPVAEKVSEAVKAVSKLTLPEVAADRARVVDHVATVAKGSDDTTSTSAEAQSQTESAAPAADATGPQNWTGKLCDDTTAVSIAYTVNPDGTISDVAPTPATAAVHQESDKGVTVSFSLHERVQIRVHANEDGSTQVRVKEKLRCEAVANDAPSTTAVDDHGHDATDDQGDDATEDANDDNGADHQGANDSAEDSGSGHDGSHHAGSDHGSDKHGGSNDG